MALRHPAAAAEQGGRGMILWPLPWLPDREPFRRFDCGPFPDAMFEACKFIALRKWRQLQRAQLDEMRARFAALGFDYDETIEYFKDK